MFKNSDRTFLDRVLSGEARLDQIDDFVDRWHESPDETGSLAEFLGFTQDEYASWIKDAGKLQSIVHKRTLKSDQKLHRFLNLRHQLALEKQQLLNRLAELDTVLGLYRANGRQSSRNLIENSARFETTLKSAPGPNR